MEQREIKFRVWSKSFGMFMASYMNHLFLNFETGLLTINEKTQKHSDYILLQYTGLKDKNGKEIYEGDILHGREEGNGETTAWTNVYYIVFFKDGAFRIRENNIDESSEWCDLLDSNDILDYYEIVGNIYENAGLLATTPKNIS